MDTRKEIYVIQLMVCKQCSKFKQKKVVNCGSRWPSFVHTIFSFLFIRLYLLHSIFKRWHEEFVFDLFSG